MYHPWDTQDQEVLRRGEPDESARFIPLLEAVWDNGSDGGFKQLKQVIRHACSGKAATHYDTVFGRFRQQFVVRGYCYVAQRNIAAGEELTIDYRSIFNWFDSDHPRWAHGLLEWGRPTNIHGVIDNLPPVFIELERRYRKRFCVGFGHGRDSDYDSFSETAHSPVSLRAG